MWDVLCAVGESPLTVLAVGDVSAIQGAVGQRVARVRRGRYSLPVSDMDEGGFLELTFVSGDVLLLDIGSDWTLTAQAQAWNDPFTEPISAENRDFVERHGRWTAVDVSQGDARLLTGSSISSASLLTDDMADVVGVVLLADGVVVSATAWGGELFVEFNTPTDR